MEDMLAFQLNDRFLTKTLDIANGTERISILFKSLFLIFSHTIFMKARWMLFFTVITIAGMIAV